MGLQEEILDYVQSNGLISPDRYPTEDSTGNGILYTALYHLLLVRLGESRPEHFEDFRRAIRACEVKMFDEKRNVFWHIDGLYNRSPGKMSEQEGPDDYIALATAAQYLRATFAKEIFSYGHFVRFACFRWFYNNLNPREFTFQSWFGRFPHVITHFQYCAGMKPNLFRRMIWAMNIFWAALFHIKDSTSCILSWLMIESIEGRSLICSIASSFWTYRMKTKWMFEMKSVIEKHLSTSHPIAKYWV